MPSGLNGSVTASSLSTYGQFNHKYLNCLVSLLGFRDFCLIRAIGQQVVKKTKSDGKLRYSLVLTVSKLIMMSGSDRENSDLSTNI